MIQNTMTFQLEITLDPGTALKMLDSVTAL